MREEGGATRHRSGILGQMPHEALQGPAEGVDRRAGFPDQGSAGTEDGEVGPTPEEAVRKDRRRTRGGGGWVPIPEGEDKASVPGASGKRTGAQAPPGFSRRRGRRFDHFQMARPRGFEPLAT